MGTHLIPRSDVKGQDRFFIIFTVSGLIGTLIGIAIALPIYLISDACGATIAGIAVMALFGSIGFVIGQVKIPDTNAFPLFKKTGGEYIKTIIMRYMKFRKNKKKFVNDASSKQVFFVKDDKIEKVVMNKE